MSIEKARLRLPALRAVQASDADVLRLVLEPVFRWLGYDPLDVGSVRREVVLLDILKRASAVCGSPSRPTFAVWLVCDPGDAASVPLAAAVMAARQSALPGWPRYVVLTTGSEWRVFDVENDGKLVASCTLDRPEPLRLLKSGVDVAGLEAKTSAAPPAPSVPKEPSSRPAAPPASPTPTPVGPAKPSGVGGPRADKPGTPSPAAPAPVRHSAKDQPPVETIRRRGDYHRAEETYSKPLYLEVSGRRHMLNHWYEAVVVAARLHLERRGTLPTKLLGKQRRRYFAQTEREIGDSPYPIQPGWYMEKRLNAALACKIALTLMRRAGYGTSQYDLLYEAGHSSSPTGERPRRS